MRSPTRPAAASRGSVWGLRNLLADGNEARRAPVTQRRAPLGFFARRARGIGRGILGRTIHARAARRRRLGGPRPTARASPTWGQCDGTNGRRGSIDVQLVKIRAPLGGPPGCARCPLIASRGTVGDGSPPASSVTLTPPAALPPAVLVRASSARRVVRSHPMHGPGTAEAAHCGVPRGSWAVRHSLGSVACQWYHVGRRCGRRSGEPWGGRPTARRSSPPPRRVRSGGG